MSKAKHTAGKWKVKSGNIVSAIYANDYQVAFISGAREEHLANARLIAEAPTLLSELEVSTSIMESVLHLFGESMAMSTKFGLTSQIESNKELLKKIEG